MGIEQGAVAGYQPALTLLIRHEALHKPRSFS